MKTDTSVHPVRNITLEEALKEPFTRKKYEDAKATLAEYPVTEELLQQFKNSINR
jgi:hypothetical protein